MCENFLYDGENSKLTQCGVCNEARYVEDTEIYKRVHGQRKKKVRSYIKTPRKVYRYFPLKHRLKQLFAHPIYSQLFGWADQHEQERINRGEEDVVQDIHHAEVWTDFRKRLPLKTASNPDGICDRRVAFMMTADSASMSTFKQVNFSITPIILAILNWPITMRYKAKHLLYTGIPPANCKNTSLYFSNIKHCIYFTAYIC